MKSIAVISVLLSALTPGACSDNPVTPEEHFEARGVVLRIADSVVATVDSGRVSGSLVLDSTRDQMFAVEFITTDGARAVPVHLHTTGVAGYELAMTIADTTAARVVAIDDHAWTATLGGVRAGSTSVVVRLLHNGHDDFVSVAIPIVVRR